MASTTKVAILLADYGHDPTETAVPFEMFKKADYDVTFVTQNGQTAQCDAKMLKGWTQKLLGAASSAVKAYYAMEKSSEWKSPKAWTTKGFSLNEYDLVYIPGGHDKGVRQLLDCEVAQRLMADYFPQTQKPSKKHCAALCHGVQFLAHCKNGDRSILYDVETTSLTDMMESSVYQATRLFLGDYYKTYGAGTENVGSILRNSLADEKQYKYSNNTAAPFVVEDPNYNYISGRWPGDAEMLAKKTIEAVARE